MPKLKTHRGLAKRVKITAKGKIKRSKSFHRHLLSHKSSKRKRMLSKPGFINISDKGRIKRLLPYNF